MFLVAGTSADTYESQCGIGCLWLRMNWLVRADVLVLGLLLVYTVAIVIRISRHYHTAPCDGDVNGATRRKLAAELNIRARNLKSIASTAPYLGLMGTCLGILSAFTGFGMAKQAALAMLASGIAGALVPAAAGIIVAISATCAYQYACTRRDFLGNELPGRKHLLTGRFTLPSFGVIAAYALIILLRAYMSFAPANSPKGLDVGIASVRCDSDSSDRLIVLHISDGGRVFLNLEEEQDWSTLQNRLSDIYAMREQRVLYLLADEGVHFQTVADAIDAVENASERVTSRPLNITVRLITPRSDERQPLKARWDGRSPR